MRRRSFVFGAQELCYFKYFSQIMALFTRRQVNPTKRVKSKIARIFVYKQNISGRESTVTQNNSGWSHANTQSTIIVLLKRFSFELRYVVYQKRSCTQGSTGFIYQTMI